MSLQGMKRRAQGSRLVGESYKGLDLRSMSAYSSVWIDVRFDDCKMQLADMSGSTLTNVTFESCRIPLGNFSRATLENVRFVYCDIEQGVFAGAVLKDAVFDNCRLAYSTFQAATVRFACFLDSNLHGADLDYIECNEARYPGSNLWGVKAAFGCAFYNGSFDDDQIGLFAAMLARLKNSMGSTRIVTLDELAAPKMAVVERLMKRAPECSSDTPPSGVPESSP